MTKSEAGKLGALTNMAARDERQAEAVTLFQRGFTVEFIARVLGVHERTAYRYTQGVRPPAYRGKQA